jgi:drug/metabolite transporter (DMT)-like permease
MSVTSGIITILLTVFAMALTDAFVKFASADMMLWQIYVCRSAIALPILIFLSKGRVWPKERVWVAVRSIALVAMYLAIYAAIPLLDLSVIAASLYTAPLFIVLLSAVFLHEPISVWQWIAVALGFVGVLVVVQPSGTEFTALSLIPIIAAFLYAVAAVLTRAKCANEAPATLAIGLNIALITFGTVASLWLMIWPSAYADSYPFLFGQWAAMNLRTLSILTFMALLIVGVGIGLARAYQSPRPQVIAIFDYAYLIFAAFWGFVFFREIPDVPTVIGIAIIIGAGVLVLATSTKLTPSDTSGATNVTGETECPLQN